MWEIDTDRIVSTIEMENDSRPYYFHFIAVSVILLLLQFSTASDIWRY